MSNIVQIHYLLKILKEEGFGGDCSSMAELVLCEKVGITGEKVMFTSNETPIEESAEIHKGKLNIQRRREFLDQFKHHFRRFH